MTAFYYSFYYKSHHNLRWFTRLFRLGNCILITIGCDLSWYPAPATKRSYTSVFCVGSSSKFHVSFEIKVSTWRQACL
jgi:hypothetical protein